MIKNDPELGGHLREKGYKITAQRNLVLGVIKENQGNHLGPEEIYDRLRDKGANIGIATVYRTLALLEEMGLIYRVELKPGSAAYELNQPDMLHKHHHLICTGCGKVLEVKEDLLENLEELILANHGFLIKDHSLKFYGLCSQCREE